jgi:hypothetical protein
MLKNRKACRAGDSCEIRSLDDALYCLGHHSELSLPQIAERAGIPPRYLSDALNPYRSSHRVQLGWLVPLLTASQNPAPVRYLAEAIGYRVEPVRALQHDTLGEEGLDVVAEVGRFAALVRQALADGHVDSREREDLRRGLTAIRTQLAEVEAALDDRPLKAVR